MRKLLFFFAAMLLMVSCNNSKSKLRAMVTAANRECPVWVDDTLTITNVEFVAGAVTYYYAVNEDYVSLDSLDVRLDTIAQSFKEEFELSEDNEFLDAFKGANAKINFIYKGTQSGDRMGFGFNPSTGETTVYHL